MSARKLADSKKGSRSLQIVLVALLLLLPPLLGSGQGERLTLQFRGIATLAVSGDVPQCGFFSSCPLGKNYCSDFWQLCNGGSRTVVAPGSYLILGGEYGGSFGYNSNATLNVKLVFGLRYRRPNVNIEGFTYTPKTDLGLGYFVEGVMAGAATIAVAGCRNHIPPCCASGSASANASARVATSLVSASVSSSYSASCGCGDAENCVDCTSDGGSSWQFDPPDRQGRRGFKAHPISFDRGDSASHTETLEGAIQLNGSSNECAVAVSIGAAYAFAGLLLQSAPHPLGVPAIGENEYVWKFGKPRNTGASCPRVGVCLGLGT